MGQRRPSQSIRELCSLLGYSRQGYYQGTKHEQQKAFEADIIIEEVLRYRKDQKRIGTRKLFGLMGVFFRQHDLQIGRDAMFDLLSERGLLVRRRRRSGCLTTFSKHRFKKYPNIIRDLIPKAPNQLWVSDITYIHLAGGYAYLSLITDAYSRKIVGFHLSKDLSAEGSLTALRMALKSNSNTAGLIHHSDRGVQYCCEAYVRLLADAQIKISMTENGDPLENAIAERVNGILKQELLEEEFPNFVTAATAVAKACSTYNHLRPHGSINDLKPADAHQMNGPIDKRWKNYYQINKKRKEDQMMV